MFYSVNKNTTTTKMLKYLSIFNWNGNIVLVFFKETQKWDLENFQNFQNVEVFSPT